jgi:hypothetical protein
VRSELRNFAILRIPLLSSLTDWVDALTLGDWMIVMAAAEFSGRSTTGSFHKTTAPESPAVGVKLRCSTFVIAYGGVATSS